VVHIYRAADSPFIYVVPYGLRRVLGWLKDRYNNPTVYITENGVSDTTGTMDDHGRIDYLRRHINEVLKGKRSPAISTTEFLWVLSYLFWRIILYKEFDSFLV